MQNTGTRLIVGSPPSVIEHNEAISVYPKYTDQSLKDIFGKHISYDSNVVIFLSGGLDSQFMACLAKEFTRDPVAVNFVFTWENNIINSDDVVMSEYIAKNLNIRYEREYVDLKEFLNTDLADYAQRYILKSPQIAAHIHAIKHSKFLDRKIFLGGDFPVVGLDNDGKIIVGVSARDMSGMSSMSHNFFNNIFLPYHRFAHQHDLDIVKGPFNVSDEAFYAGCAHNTTVISTTRKIIDLSAKMHRANIQEYKTLYYKSFGYHLIEPFFKRTGFENLRAYFASVTGRYDEFNELYRQPLENLHKQQITSNKINIDMGVFADLECELNIIDQSSVSVCNRYSFDW
jgi:7-cyano-7-deazaguanine synthase in queuosine biosynthesis